MNFARWETKENMKESVPLVGVDGTKEIKSSGLPMTYDEENLYIDSRGNHSLVIGSTGSGKTQTITLPMLELAILAGESVIIHDALNEIYEATNQKFLENGYKVIKLNFDDSVNCNYWNPFELVQKLYKEGNVDKAQDLIEDIGFYLLNEHDKNDSSDPFWINSAIDYFTGLSLYALKHEEKVNLNTILELDTKVRDNIKEFAKDIDKKSNIYISLRGIIESPKETSGSILAVFNQKIKKYMYKEKLKEKMSKSDFDITSVSKEKTIIYIVSGNSNNSEQLLPLLISQVYFAKDEYARNEKRINIIIDDFVELYPIRNFGRILNYSRAIGIMYTIMIRSLNDLKNAYGKEQAEMLKLCFGNIVYLLSQDIDTLEEISKLCGTASIIENREIPLISIEELKTLKPFEAVIITPRIMPFKTKLLPHYQIKK